MKTKSFKTILLTAILFISINIFSQTGDKNYAEIHFYRVKQSVISGATMMEAKIKINEKEVGAFLNATKLTYKIYSQGTIKINCAGYAAGSPLGQPYVTTMEVKNGEVYHIALTLSNMSGVKGIIMDAKEVKKMEKEKFVDQSEVEEDKANPVIKK